MCDVGLYGLAVMGQNLALNIASKVHRVGASTRAAPFLALTTRPCRLCLPRAFPLP